MAKVPNTRKVFKFAIEINGLYQFYAQKVTVPEVAIGVVQHGNEAGKPATKTPGIPTVGDLVVEKLSPSDKADTFAWDWYRRALRGVRTNYAGFAVLHELDETGQFPIASYDLGEIWVSKIGKPVYDRQAEDNVMETVTFAVDRYELRSF